VTSISFTAGLEGGLRVPFPQDLSHRHRSLSFEGMCARALLRCFGNDSISHARHAQIARRANVPHLFAVALSGKSKRCFRVPPPHEGRFAIVTNVGSGMRWTRYVTRRVTRSRTAKSRGPGAPTLALSWRNDPLTTVAKERGHRGDRV
jgi:hypothetical protein